MTEHESLLLAIHYDPKTGVFTWRRSGLPVSTRTRDGYQRFWCLGKTRAAARVAWFYVMGEWPAETIDHIDGNKGNNRFSNLREATRSEQQYNSPKRKGSKAIFRGVRRRKGGWYAEVKKKGCITETSRIFETPIEARAAYVVMAKRVAGGFVKILEVDLL